MQSENNTYSRFWYETFLDTITTEQTLKEIGFINHFLPKEQYTKVLDCPCSSGRHACHLLSLGYSVTGIDIDEQSILQAKKKCTTGTFLIHDMRELHTLHENFDAVICMWQSFGFFSHEINKDILKQIYDLLTLQGRFILDIYNKRFFETRQGPYESKSGEIIIKNNKFIKDGRLSTELDYGEGKEKDRFEWEIFYEDEIIALMQDIGFKILAKCSSFEIDELPSDNIPRMQLIFQK